MTVYRNQEHLLQTLRVLFEHMRNQHPNPVDTLASNRIILRINTHAPEATITINARKVPVQIQFGNTNILKPELEIHLDADTLHEILMDQLSLKSALAHGRMKLIGPVWKTFPLAEIFNQGRSLYPKIYQEQHHP